jgi:hypothetical protein
MTIAAPSAESTLALAIEEFTRKAEAFLQIHYQYGSSKEDIEIILKAVNDLKLDINAEQLEQEFELHCDRKDLEADYYDSAWF